MANRYFTQFFYSFFKKPVLLAGKFSLNASAAVTATAIKGVASVAKTGTGTYLVTLEDQYFALFSVSTSVVDSAQDIVADCSAFDLAAKTFTVTTKVAGSAANVSDACDVYLSLVLSNTSSN